MQSMKIFSGIRKAEARNPSSTTTPETTTTADATLERAFLIHHLYFKFISVFKL